MSAPSHTTDTIERELAALGEAPPSAEELGLLDRLGDHEDIASVARLAELAEPLAFEDLSELELHRSWREVEQRQQQSRGSAQPATTGAGPGPRRWLLAAAGLAAVAAVVLLVVRPLANDEGGGTGRDGDAQQVAKLGEHARATLRALDDGVSDTQRAEQIAAEYQRQLEEQGG
jgi:hypothetical protein